MNRRTREIELLLLTMLAAAPLYLTQAVGRLPLILFHLVMTGILIRVATGRGPELIPAPVMRILAFCYIGFYLIDAAVLSRSAIAASTHLVLFIAAYQPIESMQRENRAQRLLTTALIFVASLATSTHISILPFVALFTFLMFRQLIFISHLESTRSIGREPFLDPPSRPAFFYLAGTLVIGTMLFPVLPRLRNPLVKGFATPLTNASTGLSESIDFNENRTSTPDPTVIARVWMSRQASAFFTPLRLRGAVYDGFWNNRWVQTRQRPRDLPSRRGAIRIARPLGFSMRAVVQQRMLRSSRLYFPESTHSVSGMPAVMEAPTRDAYAVAFPPRQDMVTYEAQMARTVQPLEPAVPRVPPYPITPEVRALAYSITGDERSVSGKARAIERYLLRNFQYYQRPEEIGQIMTVDQFLLRERRGHCEYFAAGMVALLAAHEIPSRIVGGFYGGRINPLTGYMTVRREDAHAWVEVWEGVRWVTYDPTPPLLRPGNVGSGVFSMYAAAIGDSITYFWDRYVLTFGLGDQIALAAELIGRIRDGWRGAPAKLGALAESAPWLRILLVLAGLAVFAGILRMTRKKRTPFDLLRQHLRDLGIEVGEATTVEEALQRVRERYPEAAADLEPVVRLYEEEQFSGREDRARRRTLRARLTALRA